MKHRPKLTAADEPWLTAAAAGDAARLAGLRARVAAGEPTAYVAGFLLFRGRRFAIDHRAYITDPELTHLVDAVAEEAEVIAARLRRPPTLLEFGVGAGTLTISLQLEHRAWNVAGLDVDAAALELAQVNATHHGVSPRLLHSDYLSAWPTELGPPDIIFGDPPWGGETDLYTAERDAAYYHHMPARSAYPQGNNPCAIHDELLAQARSRRWPSRVVLNYGVLSPAIVERSTAALRDRRIRHPAPGLTIVSGNVT